MISLIGATGVGKTTTAAKLAAQCVQQYGADSVGLITLDTYRVSGYEQLRAYGRMLGVVAHLAHDRAALKDLLNLLANKRMVIIDTAGLGQRDQRIQDMLDVLDMPKIKKVLVLNAGAHGDTLDDVLTALQGQHAARRGAVQGGRGRQARPGARCPDPPPGDAARCGQRPARARRLAGLPTPPRWCACRWAARASRPTTRWPPTWASTSRRLRPAASTWEPPMFEIGHDQAAGLRAAPLPPPAVRVVPVSQPEPAGPGLRTAVHAGRAPHRAGRKPW